MDTARGKNAGKRLVFDTDVRIGLVIPKQHVVPWLQFFDKIIFQNEGFRLGIGDNDFEVADFANHHPEPAFPGAAFLKIRAHPATQTLGFADVDHLAFFVLVLINAGPRRQVGKFPFQSRRNL